VAAAEVRRQVPTYSVVVDFAGPFDGDPDAINELLETFAEGLRDYEPAIIGCPEQPPPRLGLYGARLVIDSDSAFEAIRHACEVAADSARAAGLPDWPIGRTEATEWSMLERDLEEPTYPQLVGVTELAGMVGITRQRASALARTAKFPQPAAELASGPVWFESNVRRFIEAWERKPGRPRELPERDRSRSSAEDLAHQRAAARAPRA
jgi:hypothetical protein